MVYEEIKMFVVEALVFEFESTSKSSRQLLFVCVQTVLVVFDNSNDRKAEFFEFSHSRLQ